MVGSLYDRAIDAVLRRDDRPVTASQAKKLLKGGATEQREIAETRERHEVSYGAPELDLPSSNQHDLLIQREFVRHVEYCVMGQRGTRTR